MIQIISHRSLPVRTQVSNLFFPAAFFSPPLVFQGNALSHPLTQQKRLDFHNSSRACLSEKCLATKHVQILFGHQTSRCCAERLHSIKHVWSPWKRTKCLNTRSNTIQQTGKCIITKPYLIVFDWSPNISRLDRALVYMEAFLRGSGISQFFHYCTKFVVNFCLLLWRINLAVRLYV